MHMPDELAERIAKTPVEIVKTAPEHAKEIYNAARRACGMSEVKF